MSFFFPSRRRHTRLQGDWSSDVCSSDLTARLLGYELTLNFNFPYFAASITEFWRRWHITLSSWLRDYLYISLGGNRGSALRTHVNLMVTMLLGGLWHGASWTFVVWGGLHGLGLSLERLLRGAGRGKGAGARPRGGVAFARHFAAIAVTFGFVHLTWVFFRAADFTIAARMLERMFVAPFIGAGGGVHVSSRFAVLLVPI